jgi:hypothetical protein
MDYPVTNGDATLIPWYAWARLSNPRHDLDLPDTGKLAELRSEINVPSRLVWQNKFIVAN